MPVQQCNIGVKPGYKWGEQGKCYTYIPGNESSANEAKKKAYVQGIAAIKNGSSEELKKKKYSIILKTKYDNLFNKIIHMAKRQYTPGWGRISNKLTKLLKEKIKQLNLIDTQLMYDSIYCTYKGDSIIVHVEHYFKYHDGDYDIIESCINSQEFQSYVQTVMVEEIEYTLKDIK